MGNQAHSDRVMFGIVLGSVLILAVLGSAWLLIRDMHRLRRAGRSLTSGPNDAAGLSAAGMVWQNNAGMR
jgi:hypothetical protein